MKTKRKPEMTVSQKMAQLSTAKRKRAKVKTRFFQDIKEEMKKVSWTTREELITCTKIVVGAIFAFGIGIYIVDLFIRFALQSIGNLVRLIT